MENWKYRTEFNVNMFGHVCFLLQQDGFGTLEQSGFNEKDPCHIYMITRRPRIMINPDSVKFRGDLIDIQFLIQDGSNMISERVTLRNLIGSDLIFDCPYPHTEYFIYDKKETLVGFGKAALLLQNLNAVYRECLSLEVLYIGQSYGVEGARSAPKRLQNHSTLQGIYAEAIRRTPDKEIWLVLWGFTPMAMSVVDGSSKTFEKTEDEDDRHIEQFYKDFISEQQLINYTEAALIRYFEPEYNVTFKNSFPNPAHSTYSECYDLDIHSVNVELQTEEINCQLYSPKVAPKWVQFASFRLRNPMERKSILDEALPDN